MRFLQKGNRNATVRSTLVWTLGGAIAMSVPGAILWRATGADSLAAICFLIFLPLAGAVGAFAVEWQVDDGADSED